jgi:hypothetical protein
MQGHMGRQQQMRLLLVGRQLLQQRVAYKPSSSNSQGGEPDRSKGPKAHRQRNHRRRRRSSSLRSQACNSKQTQACTSSSRSSAAQVQVYQGPFLKLQQLLWGRLLQSLTLIVPHRSRCRLFLQEGVCPSAPGTFPA